jgi:hypothetical protein|tara:strand:- start:790 stop:1164 length:375 start_codon:yes stop_codon:yes gene_type:complete
MEYDKFIKNSLQYKNARDQRSKDVSHDSLLKQAKKKIQTTMIGSLSDIENYFGFLWGFGDNNTELSEEQKHMKEIFEEVRAKILDRGNTQIREIELEFVNYEISRKKFYIKLPVQNPEGEQNDG